MYSVSLHKAVNVKHFYTPIAICINLNKTRHLTSITTFAREVLTPKNPIVSLNVIPD